ncbi:hypothetical protein SLV14_000198 [Streptomyces sp. Je 1-4]|uniref:hypothetical protein n=1 Tax=Streptomyces TaxID=1883 RepID=UPI0021D9ACD7|nr:MULTISPECIES: hypothetical protein [unclassified Streptomyces]UYB37900.1 hypothetical protein SLV14_000198 [Streptomyces sp. Je 1-4]UZQ33827.1 hypothetical protein SLV14N_000198 [Streptomyces sp. Je 1-4] [Streptomyces sp. Je 1-4 4N24]UZQ41245.1 hypothetical protein SLV14NA_000198 [Streptomyces sp. Je 1-4] [Streptomyces sp. Je 1-4 4N24_ara]
MHILDGDFVVAAIVVGQPRATRFSGLITAPGVEGALQDVLVVREAPIPPEMAESLISATETSHPESTVVRRDDDETASLPARLAAMFLGESAKSDDPTDQDRRP